MCTVQTAAMISEGQFGFLSQLENYTNDLFIITNTVLRFLSIILENKKLLKLGTGRNRRGKQQTVTE